MSPEPKATPRVVITPGEPAGIGPDVVLSALQQPWPAELVVVADEKLMRERAEALGLSIDVEMYSSGRPPVAHQPGRLKLAQVDLNRPVMAGQLDSANASYVLATLNLAAELCQAGEAQALVTAPVQKSVINDAGIPFSGHTEFFAELTDTAMVVMMLATGELRVALVTTHIPLKDVPAAITAERLESTINILAGDLNRKFGLSHPRITVLGLNPHAGEGGHLGREEIEVISPMLERLRDAGLNLKGPLPADTAFNPDIRAQTDAYLAMYHDQGLPVLKALGFGEAVNITLGLPFIRTSVDHGTALTLAGTGEAKSGSMLAAINQALDCIKATQPSS